MTSILNFKNIIDLPKWRPLSSGIIAVNVYGCDMRNNEDRHPIIYANLFGSNFSSYNVKSDEWNQLTSLALASASCSIFMPAQGPRGTIAAGATTTSVPLSTALPATIGVNSLANRGDGRGFKVRVIGNAVGSSGKTEERYVIANTGQTTTPTLILDVPLSFVPILGDAYEFLSGRLFVLGQSNAAGAWKYYDVLTGANSGNLATANLPASFSDSNLIGLDELFVPYDKSPGEGFMGICTATGSGAASLTGMLASGDYMVLANEHRNFQIRIVEDIAIPTAVGQRRNIISHTAGPSPVYTVSAWTVQPSATAKYVIENNGDRIICWVSASTQTSTYTISTNSWDANTTFAVRPAAPGTGLMSHQAFSIEPDIAKNARHSFIYSFRAGTSNTLDLFDMAGAATGVWTNGIIYGNAISTNFTNSCSTQDPATNQGRYIYIIPSITSNLILRLLRFDMKNRVLENAASLKVITAISPAVPFKQLAYTVFVDGNTKLSYIIYSQSTGTQVNPLFGLPITI